MARYFEERLPDVDVNFSIGGNLSKELHTQTPYVSGIR
jgi:hypothetical protein